jgi:hypothetical protein
MTGEALRYIIRDRRVRADCPSHWESPLIFAQSAVVRESAFLLWELPLILQCPKGEIACTEMLSV